MPRLPALLAGLLLALCATTAGAADAVRLLVDVSGSMREHDPEQLRAPALQLAVDLLPEGTEAGVWRFADVPETVAPPAAVSADWRQATRGEVARIDSRGQYTDLTAAIEAATADWTGPAEDGRRSLILLSDGVIDVADGADAAARRRLIEETLPRLQAADVSLYPVSLSTDEGIDEALLLRLAASTGGEVIVAADAEALERRLAALLDRVTRGDALPLRGNRFQVDQSVRELTLVAFRPQAAEIRLQPPAGPAFGPAEAPGNVRWREERRHALVTISRPMTGEWTLEAPPDPDNRVSVVTDLRLRGEPLPPRLLPGEAARVTAWLADGERRIEAPRFLELVRVTATGGAAETPHALTPDAEGRFHTPLQALAAGPGDHEIVLRADGGTFEREWRQRVRIEASPVAVTEAPAEPGQLRLDAALASDWLAPGSVSLKASYAGAGLRGEALQISDGAAGGWQLEATGLAPGTPVLVTLRLTGMTRSGRPVTALLAPQAFIATPLPATAEPVAGATGQPGEAAAAASDTPQAPPPEPEGSTVNWWLVAAVLILANVFVIAAALITWLLLRRRGGDDDDAEGGEDTGEGVETRDAPPAEAPEAAGEEREAAAGQ